MTRPPLRVRYTNHRGETAIRHVYSRGQPYWGSNEYHPEEQWLWDVVDADREVHRTFAMKDCDFTAPAEDPAP